MIGCGQALPGHNMPARLYAKWLAAFLDQFDRFFDRTRRHGGPDFVSARGQSCA
jgi:hypothetical protein